MRRSKDNAPAKTKRIEHMVIVQKALRLVLARIKAKTIRISMGDVLKLMEYADRLAPRESVRETIVTWVDPYQESQSPESDKEELIVP